MKLWERLIHRAPSPPGPGPAADRPSPERRLPPLQPKVLLITYNPIMRQSYGRRLTEVLGWRSVDLLCQGFIADLQECSNGYLQYKIVDRMEVDAWPAKVDGYRYDEARFLRNWGDRSGWHEPDTVDYQAILAKFDLLARVESGQVDEVWLFAFPYAGFYESVMVGPGAFWCNSPPIARANGISRRFVIMGFNYERGVGPMLESFGHRVESHLRHAWRHKKGEDNLWERFTRYDKTSPGRANCGWMHYAPNSQTDYDWGNPDKVLSNCDDWLNYPDFQGSTRLVDCRDWGEGNMRAHHKWWFKRLPNAPGNTSGLSNNWWWYGVDPNAVR